MGICRFYPSLFYRLLDHWQSLDTIILNSLIFWAPPIDLLFRLEEISSAKNKFDGFSKPVFHLSNLTFFIVNTYSHPFDTSLLIKQVSNLLSFLVLKFLAINRFNRLFVSNIKLVEIQRSMEAKQRIQKLMGELCHLLNNPMFITMNFTKKILKTRNIDDAHEFALKSLSSIERMKSVSNEMLKIYDGKDSNILDDESASAKFPHS